MLVSCKQLTGPLRGPVNCLLARNQLLFSSEKWFARWMGCSICMSVLDVLQGDGLVRSCETRSRLPLFALQSFLKIYNKCGNTYNHHIFIALTSPVAAKAVDCEGLSFSAGLARSAIPANTRPFKEMI